jgi:DNA-binding IclR family transcriptional regulator
LSLADAILRLLENGKWHNLKELQELAQLNSHKVQNITRFLAEYNLVRLDESEQKVKLDISTKKFLNTIRQLEGKEM